VNTTPYWLAEARAPVARLRRVDEPVDVVVIGGGVTGCSCALTLAEHGVRVVLHEAREIAAGASGRNGGFALRGGAMPYEHRYASLWRLTERALDRLEELAGDAFARVGSVRVALDARERDALEREYVALREDGFDAEWIEPLPGRLGRIGAAGLVHPGDGSLQPARWVRRLAARAADAGAVVREGSHVRVDEVDATAVVVAVDALSADLLPELSAVVSPQRGQMLATVPIAERLFTRPHYAREGFDYWQQLADGRLVVGGKRDASFATEATDVEETTALVQRELELLVVELAGWLPEVTHRWAGVWGETPDRLPLVGRLPTRENVWIAGGYSGHGNVLGLACGELVARAVLGETPPELRLFDPARSELDALHVAD
jgi:gamma-glutamylputrescine oxidase